MVQKKVSLHCKLVTCLKLVNHGFPSKSGQEIHSESVKSVQALLCFMYVCMYVTAHIWNDALLNIWELMCSLAGSQRINDSDLGLL